MLAHVKLLAVPTSASALASFEMPPDFGDLGHRLFELHSFFPQAAVLVRVRHFPDLIERSLTHVDLDAEAHRGHPPYRAVARLERSQDRSSTGSGCLQRSQGRRTQSILEDLICRLDAFLGQLRDSLSTKGARRPSMHLAVLLVARYIICGAGIARMVEFDHNGEQSIPPVFQAYAGQLAGIAVTAAAVLYYENCALQVANCPSTARPDVTEAEAEDIVGIIAEAWADSLLQYSVPDSYVSPILRA